VRGSRRPFRKRNKTPREQPPVIYGEIKQERIWLVATTHIPELVRLLKPLLPPFSDSMS